MSATESQVAYAQAHANEYNATGFVAFCVAGICIITVATALRFWSRKLQRTAWQSDDWTLLVALVCTLVCDELVITFQMVLKDVRMWKDGLFG